MQNIVIVEDNQIVSRIYAAKLQSEGFRVEVAASGEAGLELTMRTRPDLVLLDLMLPGMNGIEVLKAIRADAETRSTPVVVFSSTYQSKLVEEAWSAGATQLLSKSSDTPNKMVDAVKQCIASRSFIPEKRASLKLLLHSPSEHVRGSLSEILKNAGYDVCIVKSEPEFIHQAHAQNFDGFLHAALPVAM